MKVLTYISSLVTETISRICSTYLDRCILL